MRKWKIYFPLVSFCGSLLVIWDRETGLPQR